MRSSVPENIQKHWHRATQALEAEGVLTTPDMLPLLSFESCDYASLLGQIVEMYMMRLISPYILPWFKESTAKADRALHLQIMCLRDRSQSDLGIPAEFQANHDNAVAALCKLEQAITPLEKLHVLQKVSSIIRQNVQINVEKNGFLSYMELATDDLIAIIIWVIVQASFVYIDVPADVRYIIKFHFTESSCSSLGFTLCNFRVLDILFRFCVNPLVICTTHPPIGCDRMVRRSSKTV